MRWRKRGQATVESIIVLIAILIVFLTVLNLGDYVRARILVENAAIKCARARAVGYNDFMLRKIARLATMPVAGECKIAGDDGSPRLSYGERYSRISSYLMSDYEAQADAILDFEHWREGNTSVEASVGNAAATATVTQRRPRLFDISLLVGGDRPDDDARDSVSATATVESHYPFYLQ